jgi:hypothetical protein
VVRTGAQQPEPATCPGPLQTGGITGTFKGFDVVVVTGGVFTPNATCPDPCTTAAMLTTFFPQEGGAAPATSTVNSGWEYQYLVVRAAEALDTLSRIETGGRAGLGAR